MSDAATLTPPVKAPKEAKEVKAPKASKEKKAPGERKGNLSKLYPEDAKLTVLVDKNPKKVGSKAHGRFEHYFKVKTVGEFLAVDKSHGYNDITYDVGHGFIKVG